jgi:SH3 domain protein
VSKKRIICLIVGALLSATAYSETVYISDIQFVAIREGLDNSTRAVERGLKSGTPLDILDRNDGYTKVRTPNGNEGWVADYFLSEEIVTRSQMSTLQTRLDETAQRRVDVSNALKSSEEKIEELNSKNALIQEENSELKRQLESISKLSEKAKAIVSQNENVSYQIASLKQQTEIATSQAEHLKSSTEQKWFMIGAITLFSGLFLGVLIPALRRKKSGTGSWS